MDWTGTLGQELFLLLGFLASSVRLDVAASTESLRFRGATVKEIPFFKAFPKASIQLFRRSAVQPGDSP